MKLKYYLRGLGAGILVSTIILSTALGTKTKVELTDDEIIERAQALGMEMKSSGVNVDYDAINESINGTSVDKNADSTISTDNTEDQKNTDESQESLVDDQDNKVENQEGIAGSPEDTSNKDSEQNDDSAKNDGESIDEESTEETSSESSLPDEEGKETVSDNSQSDSPKKENSTDSEKSSDEVVIEEQPVTKSITIRPGMTAKQVSQLLENQGVIASAESFSLYLLENNLTQKIISKKVEIAVNTDYETIAAMITE